MSSAAFDPTSMPSSLELGGLSYAWPDGGAPLFGPLDMVLPGGQVVALLGANGAGKSTLLRILAGRLAPASGTVTVSARPARPTDFNYMVQDVGRLLFPHLTLRENAALPFRTSSVVLPAGSQAPGGGALDDLIREALATSGLPEADLERYPARCSGGQRQRAILCRTIGAIPHCGATLMDEPFSQISREAKPALYALIRRTARKSGRPILAVTHDVTEALVLGDAVAVLCGGRLDLLDASCVHDAKDAVESPDLIAQIHRLLIGPEGLVHGDRLATALGVRRGAE